MIDVEESETVARYTIAGPAPLIVGPTVRPLGLRDHVLDRIGAGSEVTMHEAYIRPLLTPSYRLAAASPLPPS